MLCIAFSGTNKVFCLDRWKSLEMRFLFVKPSFAYFHFLWGENTPIGSCMGVVAAFMLLKPLSNFHKIWYERYSVSAQTILFLLIFYDRY
jgi:hypothetical protein